MKIGKSTLNYSEFLIVIENIPLSKEDKKELIELAKFQYDFIDFVADKFGTTENASEIIIEINTSYAVKTFFDSIGDNDYSSMTECDIIKSVGKANAIYAKEIGFQEYEKIETFSIRFYEISKTLLITI